MQRLDLVSFLVQVSQSQGAYLLLLLWVER
jgi:hypothetical protein